MHRAPLVCALLCQVGTASHTTLGHLEGAAPLVDGGHLYSYLQVVLLAAELALLRLRHLGARWLIFWVIRPGEVARVASEAEQRQRWLLGLERCLVLEVRARVKELEHGLGQARPRDGHVGALMVAEHGAGWRRAGVGCVTGTCLGGAALHAQRDPHTSSNRPY